MLAMMGLLARQRPARPAGAVPRREPADDAGRGAERIRGNRIAMIFQDPMTSLNPYLTIERQMTEVLELHKGMTRPTRGRARSSMLERCGIPEPARAIDSIRTSFGRHAPARDDRDGAARASPSC